MDPVSTNRLDIGGIEVSWVDLIDVGPDDRVVLVGGATSLCAAHLRQRTDHLVVLSGDQVRGATLAEADLVCVDGVRLRGEAVRALAGALAPGGTWVQVSDNALSPLRLLDRLRGRRGGGDLRPSPGHLVRSVERTTQREVRQLFALLRSSRRPVTAFDARSASGMRVTLAGDLTHVGGLRGLALRLAMRLPASLVARLVPGWLVVAGPAGATAPDRVIGKIANDHSDEVKIVRGDPPSQLEKHFVRSEPTAEARALVELTGSTFSLAPELLALDGSRLRYRWLTGRTLEIPRLSEEELLAWTDRAAAVLADLQAATRQPDGSVLVHGDYWLGNVLVEGDRICGVLDWTMSRRGPADVDRDFLVEGLVGQYHLTPRLRARLDETVARHVPSGTSPD